MKSVKAILFIVSIVAASIQGRRFDLKEERLVSQSRRTIEGYIENLSTEIANFKTNYFLQLSALGIHADLMKEKLEGTALHLDTLSLLEGNFHVCVEQHRSNIPVFEFIKRKISDCVTSALQYLNRYLEPAEEHLENLTNYFKKQLKINLNDCYDGNSEESRFDCLIATIRESNVVTIRIRKEFTRALHAAEFESEHRIKQALDCGFNVLYETILKVGETQSTLSQCVDKSEEQPIPCPNSDNLSIYGRTPTAQPNSTGLCKNVINLSSKTLDVRNSTIQIPAHAIESNISCVRIYFIEEHKAHSSSSPFITR